jgi:hypothetical protein
MADGLGDSVERRNGNAFAANPAALLPTNAKDRASVKILVVDDEDTLA